MVVNASAVDTETYLYNGVELPVLPDWDKKIYPYAFITYYNPDDSAYEKYYLLTYSETPIVCQHTTLFYYRTNGEAYSCRLTSGEWGEPNADSFPISFAFDGIWANHDIISTTDGTVFLAASDPVPVGGAVTPTLTATTTATQNGAKVSGTAAGLSADSTYCVEAEVYYNGELVPAASGTSAEFTGSSADWSLSFDGCTTNTWYAVQYTLYENGVATDVTYSTLLQTLNMDPIFETAAVAAGKTSIVATFRVLLDDLSEIWAVRGTAFADGAAVATGTSDLFGGYSNGVMCTINGLSPGTTYNVVYEVLRDGEATPSTYTDSVTTTPSAEGDDSTGDGTGEDTGGDTGSDTGTSGTSTDYTPYLTIIIQTLQSSFADILSRLDALVSSITSSAENALNTSASDTTQAVASTVYGPDSALGVTGSTVTDAGSMGDMLKSMFSSNVSIGDFFGLFNDSSLIGWFSEENAASMNTVPVVNSLDDADPYNHSTYDEHYERYMEFVGYGGDS